MARRLRKQFPGAVYHAAFRGNGRAPIFGDDADRVRLTQRDAAKRLGLASGSAVGYLTREVKLSARIDPAMQRLLESTTR